MRKLNVTDGQTDRQTDGWVGVVISPVPGLRRRGIWPGKGDKNSSVIYQNNYDQTETKILTLMILTLHQKHQSAISKHKNINDYNMFKMHAKCKHV